MPEIKNSTAVRNEFRARGETIAGWASRNGFPAGNVYAVLGGRNKGDYGQAHQIAVALGLKEPAQTN